MNTWVKFEKSLETDPRVLRMAKAVEKRFALVTEASNAGALSAVTLVCGALARFWCYADTHAREDDTIDMSPAELDEWLGIPGFCELMPGDWLRDIGDGRIELPGFQEHNGTEARKSDLNAKRQQRHREKTKRERVTTRNAPALPDQDQDQDQDLRSKRVPSEPVPQNGTDVPRGSNPGEAEAVARIFTHWRTAHGHLRSRLDAKRRKLIHAALKNYSEADLCQSITGYLNSPHHMGENDRGVRYDDIELFLRDAKHIDAGLRFYAEPPKPKSKAQYELDANVAAGREWLERSNAA